MKHNATPLKKSVTFFPNTLFNKTDNLNNENNIKLQRMALKLCVRKFMLMIIFE